MQLRDTESLSTPNMNNIDINTDTMQNTPNDETIKIFAGKLFDPYTTQIIPNRLITVSSKSGLVTNVEFYTLADLAAADLKNPNVLDLSGLTVLPGFVDVHVHFFLHPYSETSWDDQLTKESLTERTVRATVHAKRTLMAGYTAVRDLGTEGAKDADIALRKCLSGPNPIVPGPRYYCANRAIVTTGSYGPRSNLRPNHEGVEGITGAEVADGIDGCIKAVRRQVGAGADWIKVYADYRYRARMADVSSATAGQSIDTFTSEELQAIVRTAHSLGVKVAAHSYGSRCWKLLAGDICPLDTLEHANNLGEAMEEERETYGYIPPKRSNTTWVPTLGAFYTSGQENGRWDQAVRTFQTILEEDIDGMKIACGGDTCVFAHGDNALEMKLMVRLGADWKSVLKWGTLGGWECIRSMRWEGKEGERRLARVEELREDARIVGDNEVPFGAVKKGFAADIIATKGDLENNFEDAVDKGSIAFVMKAGRVYKKDGAELV